jgi:hypothetical protein
MKTTTKTVRGASTLESILRSNYGTSALECDWIAIEWAADRVADSAVLATEVKRVRAARQRVGMYCATPTFGTRLWDAWMAA